MRLEQLGAALALGVVLAVATGCGQTGPLVLPERTPAAAGAAGPLPERQDEEGDDDSSGTAAGDESDPVGAAGDESDAAGAADGASSGASDDG
jgi:predicted small lipoprotein YifL